MNITPQNAAVEVHDLTVTYNKKPALWDVDFLLPQGKIIGVIGPNGAGKSTLIKAMMGLIPISSGWVKLFNEPLNTIRQQLSYVPQRESVDWDFPASVMDVVLMGRYGHQRGFFKRTSKKDKTIALKCLQKVRMEEFVNRQIAQLSGGQQQRVFLARALAQQAQLYLMDEPFAGIDASTERAILELLIEMRNEGKTIVVVHHDLQSAYEFFDWMVMLNTRLVACGPKKDVFTQKILNETYGGTLSLLSSVSEMMAKNELPVREKKY